MERFLFCLCQQKYVYVGLATMVVGHLPVHYIMSFFYSFKMGAATV